MEKLLQTIFSTEMQADGTLKTVTTTSDFFICIGLAVVLGVIMSLCYMFKNEYSKNLAISISLMPPIITVLIMLVSGNLGAAIAVGGVFALTRFRSAQGTAIEITHVLLSMAVGLTLGLGYVFIAIILVVIVECMNVIFTLTHFAQRGSTLRVLKVTIPENLDYNGLFDDLFEKYTTASEFKKVRLSNLGTMFQLTYEITLKDISKEKEFIDKIRERNANLDILCSRVETSREEL